MKIMQLFSFFYSLDENNANLFSFFHSLVIFLHFSSFFLHFLSPFFLYFVFVFLFSVTFWHFFPPYFLTFHLSQLKPRIAIPLVNNEQQHYSTTSQNLCKYVYPAFPDIRKFGFSSQQDIFTYSMEFSGQPVRSVVCIFGEEVCYYYLFFTQEIT